LRRDIASPAPAAPAIAAFISGVELRPMIIDCHAYMNARPQRRASRALRPAARGWLGPRR